MISYVMPTRDRPERLNLTLAALGALKGHEPGDELIIVDNNSRFPPTPPERLANGLKVKIVYRASNEGAASRNAGAAAADRRSEWIVMRDDDSYPVDTGFIRRLMKAPEDVAAVSADIYLPGLAKRESGGLPEVFVGCGVSIRRKVFDALGGYDPGFGYYAEEYDLAARMLLAGLRIEFDPWYRVEHHKVAQNRDMDLIVARLVRNNGWVMQRYAPDACRRERLRETRQRYRAIAAKERAMTGYRVGLLELRATVREQKRTPMTGPVFDRFTGLAHARTALAGAHAKKAFITAAVVDEGKNAWVVHRALAELDVRTVPLAARGGADVLVIGTMSPGPMLDAFERRSALSVAGGPRVIAPWLAVSDRSPRWTADVLVGGGVRRAG